MVKTAEFLISYVWRTLDAFSSQSWCFLQTGVSLAHFVFKLDFMGVPSTRLYSRIWEFRLSGVPGTQVLDFPFYQRVSVQNASKVRQLSKFSFFFSENWCFSWREDFLSTIINEALESAIRIWNTKARQSDWKLPNFRIKTRLRHTRTSLEVL